MDPTSCTLKSIVLMPAKKPEEIEKLHNDPKPPQVLLVLAPLMRMSRPKLSVAHIPEIRAVDGSKPVKSKVVRKVRVTLIGSPFACCQIQRLDAVFGNQDPGMEFVITIAD